MSLYSLNGAIPDSLPHRIVLPSGFTRTDPASFTADEIADAGYVAAPDRPEVPAGQVLEWTGTDWLLRPDSDPERQLKIDAAWERIKIERDRRQLEGGVLVDGKWFLSNDREAGRYNSLLNVAAAMGAPANYVLRPAWRSMADGVTADMTVTLARQILVAGMAAFAAIDDAALAHKAAMEASDDPAAYDFSGGWPAVFGDSA